MDNDILTFLNESAFKALACSCQQFVYSHVILQIMLDLNTDNELLLRNLYLTEFMSSDKESWPWQRNKALDINNFKSFSFTEGQVVNKFQWQDTEEEPAALITVTRNLDGPKLLACNTLQVRIF